MVLKNMSVFWLQASQASQNSEHVWGAWVCLPLVCWSVPAASDSRVLVALARPRMSGQPPQSLGSFLGQFANQERCL